MEDLRITILKMHKTTSLFFPTGIPVITWCLVGLLSAGALGSNGVLGQSPGDPGKNELKINAVYLLAGYPEISYERILGEETAVGLSVGFGLDDSFGLNFGMFPYYRLFFGKKQAAGFFVEGNGALYSEPWNGGESAKTGAGLGLALGGKFLTKGGWVAELYLGAGRNFLNTDDLSVAYPRFGIQIGKRF